MTDTDIVTRLAREADPEFGNEEGDMADALCGVDAIRRFAALVAEECAKVCEAEASGPPTAGFVYADGFIDGASKCGDAIRAKFKA